MHAFTSAWPGRCWSCSLLHSWSCAVPLPVCRSWCTGVNMAPPRSCRRQTHRTELLYCRRSCSPTAQPHIVCAMQIGHLISIDTEDFWSQLSSSHSLVFDAWGFSVAVTPDSRPSCSLIGWEWWGGRIDSETADVTISWKMWSCIIKYEFLQ